MKKITIIGAGITGLTLGWLLKKKHGSAAEIQILEKASSPGGWMKTVEIDNFLFELGPRSCRTKGNGRYTLKLVEALELKEQIIPAHPNMKQRYLYCDKKLQPLPTSLWSFFKSPLMKGVLPALIKEVWSRPSPYDDETIYSFVSRRFGSHIAERFFDPMVSGIYAGDIRALSIKSCFPLLFEMEQKHGSVIKGALLHKKDRGKESPFIESMQRFPLFSFHHGMRTLVEALASPLRDNILYDSDVKALSLKNDTFHIELDGQKNMTCHEVYSTIPAHTLAPILSSWSPSLSEELSKIDTASIATVSLGYKSDVLPYKGFGHLIPHDEGEDILGVVWDSSAFPEQNRHTHETRLTVMMGGKKREDLVKESEDSLTAIALRGVFNQLNIVADPDTIKVSYARNAIPQYNVGHSDLLKRIYDKRSSLSKNLHLLGNSFDGISVNDCIASAFRALEYT